MFSDANTIPPHTAYPTRIRLYVGGIFLFHYQHSSGSRCRSWPRRDIRPSQIYSSDRKPCAFARYLWFHDPRSEEHTSELQSLMRISYAVFCLKKKKNTSTSHNICSTYKNNNMYTNKPTTIKPKLNPRDNT